MQITPKPIILVEGYLALHDPRVREFFSCKIFLDVPHEVRITRRTKFLDDIYQEKILIPMHEQYVEPNKQYADYIINVDGTTKEGVLEKVSAVVLKFLKPYAPHS